MLEFLDKHYSDLKVTWLQQFETNSQRNRVGIWDWTEGRIRSESILMKPLDSLPEGMSSTLLFWEGFCRQPFSFVTMSHWWRFTELEAHLTDWIIQERMSHSSYRWISRLAPLKLSSCHTGRSCSRFWFRTRIMWSWHWHCWAQSCEKSFTKVSKKEHDWLNANNGRNLLAKTVILSLQPKETETFMISEKHTTAKKSENRPRKSNLAEML